MNRFKVNDLSHSCRGSRWLEALSPESFRIDERSSVELIAFAGRYAKLIAYFNDSDQEEGDWTAFLRQDVSFLLAEICSIDSIAEYKKSREQELSELKKSTADAVSRIRRWEVHAEALAVNRSADSLELSVLGSIRDSIKIEFADLFDKSTFRFLNSHSDELLDPWETILLPQVPIMPPVICESGSKQDLLRWGAIFSAVNRATERLSVVAQRYLERSLTEKSDHPPHTALFLTFTELFKHSIDHLNQITGRHLDYYYHDVLRLFPKPARPDQVAVYIELSDQANDRLVLQRGTKLSAGEDADGHPLVFKTNKKLSVSHAQVAALQAVYVQRDRSLKNRSDADIHGIYVANAVDSEDGRGKEVTESEHWWQPFGRHSDRVDGQLEFGRDAFLGIAVASPLLLMKEGSRYIRLSIRFKSNTESQSTAHTPEDSRETSNKDIGKTLKQALDAVKKRFDDVESCIPDLGFESYKPFLKLLSSCFRVSLSSAEGEFTAEVSCDNIVTCCEGGENYDQLSLSIRLDASAPPIVPPQVSISGINDASAKAWPWLKITLDPLAPVYPYKEFCGLLLERVNLEVKVNGLRTLGLENEQGPLDLGKPFPIFGTSPRKGSYLLLSSDELWRKPLDEIDLQVRWANLPSKGLDTHYSAYNVNNGEQLLDSTSFRATFSEKTEFQWNELQPVNRSEDVGGTDTFTGNRVSSFNDLTTEDKSFQLFELLDDDCSSTDGTSEWQFQLSGLTYHLDPPKKIPPRHDHSLGAGFFRLELSAPAEGFGLELYPRILTEALRQPLPGAISKMTRGVAQITTNAVQSALRVPLAGVKGLKELSPVVLTGGDGVDEANSPNPELPKPPFVPLVSSVVVGYSAKAEVPWRLQHTASTGEENLEAGQVYRVDPQSGELATFNDDFLLPKFVDDGYLQIGLAAATAGEVISLLFLMKSTTVDVWQNSTSKSPLSERLRWRYLTHKDWTNLPSDFVLSDSTMGFSRTGIVELRLPRDSVEGKTDITRGLHWLSVSVKEPDRYGSLLQIVSNAVVATRELDQEQLQNSFVEPHLKPGSINSLYDKAPLIKSVVQPFASFGGQAAENNRRFRTRVSERLAHKQRAITPSDYEKLVLQAFPDISDVKCITGVPGEVTLVVGAQRSPMSDMTRSIEGPIVPEHRLKAIADYLRPLVPPSVAADDKLRIRNPRYEQVRVVLSLKLKFDEEEVRFEELEKTIATYISPWLFDPELPLPIGSGCLDISELSVFLKRKVAIPAEVQLSFVHLFSFDGGKDHKDYWAIEDTAREEPKRNVLLSRQGKLKRRATDANRLQFKVNTASPCSVLVPADNPYFNVIDSDEEVSQFPLGVGKLKIGQDLIIDGGNESPPVNTAEHYSLDQDNREA